MSRFMIWAIAVSGLIVFASSANASICGAARLNAEKYLAGLDATIVGGTLANGSVMSDTNALIGRISANNYTPTVTNFAQAVNNFAWALSNYVNAERALLNCLDVNNLD
jgi:hypothetical protein